MKKFIVLEGLDGSGKSTQVEKLKNYFDKNSIAYKYVHFPRTTSPFFGDLISRFLRGELGKIDEVDPYLVAMLYAGDRHAHAHQIREWLDIGSVVLVDRYVISNIAFQGAKLESEEEKTKLRQWIYQFEYEHYRIPRPEISLFLDAPINFVKKNLESQRLGDDRDYLKGKTDIHEEKIEFQEKVRQEYLKAMKIDAHSKRIDCIENNKMLSPDLVFQRILAELQIKNIV